MRFPCRLNVSEGIVVHVAALDHSKAHEPACAQTSDQGCDQKRVCVDWGILGTLHGRHVVASCTNAPTAVLMWAICQFDQPGCLEPGRFYTLSSGAICMPGTCLDASSCVCRPEDAACHSAEHTRRVEARCRHTDNVSLMSDKLSSPKPLIVLSESF